MLGTVFAIEEFSLYDGPGIRSTVFLKGCPLRCTWCHNPEGQTAAPQILRSPNGCIGCGRCEQTAKVCNGQLCYTEESRLACPRGLLRRCGETWHSDALCDKLLKNRHAYAISGGGVTFSGGEPLEQAAFVVACLRLLKGKAHTAVQTCGFAPEAVFRRMLENSDYVLYDLKLADDALHRRYTGATNAPIRRNLSLLAHSGVDFTVRIPLIPGVTDTAANVAALAGWLQEEGITYAELLPYNPAAGGKYRLTGRTYDPGFDQTLPVQPRQEVWSRYGVRTVIL